ncbi:hypothetical protein [Nisaea sediminum]|uniref:hypothetical protein n=1 Tax=Nisaea sediminum TaxID=2775867 RepID=UPI0018694986|nr:hypothetical protein [Nisaea sediminum]
MFLKVVPGVVALVLLGGAAGQAADLPVRKNLIHNETSLVSFVQVGIGEDGDVVSIDKGATSAPVEGKIETVALGLVGYLCNFKQSKVSGEAGEGAVLTLRFQESDRTLSVLQGERVLLQDTCDPTK